MRSASPVATPPRGAKAPDDRTARARIRDAAIASFANHGIRGTTARRVAAEAGVSPGLVIHHFGSMEGLRAACDDHVAAVIRQHELETLAAGPTVDVLAALRDPKLGSLAGYLARVLVDDSPAVARLVDDLVADAEGYLEEGVAAGTLRPTSDARGRAVVLTTWSLGALVLHRHVERLLGVDLTAPDVGRDPAFTAYARPVAEIYGEGILSEAFARRLRDALSEPAPDPETQMHAPAAAPEGAA